MSETRASIEIPITNPQGLHARPSSLVVRTANSFRAQVTMSIGDRVADCKSIMEVLMLASPQGTVVTIEATGPEAEQAVAAIAALFRQGFGET